MTTILAAAIKDETGKVHFMSSPARHHHIIWWMRGKYDELVGLPRRNDFVEEEQGFITDAGVYVTREEALIIARAAGQLIEETNDIRLYSEDLW